jgi:negative regulator of flagellin synthesis FlgM
MIPEDWPQVCFVFADTMSTSTNVLQGIAVKIDTAYQQRTPAPSGQSAAKAARTPPGAEVALSDAAQLHGDEAPIDASRVREIKEAIAAGRFRINPEAIADRLISTAQELIGAQRKV